MPKHIFDPKGLSDQYSWDDIAAIIEKVANPDNLDSAKIAKMARNPAMKDFADWMTTPELGRDPKYIQGSGPYKLALWSTNDRIILNRNPNYINKGNSPLGIVYPDTSNVQTYSRLERCGNCFESPGYRSYLFLAAAIFRKDRYGSSALP